MSSGISGRAAGILVASLIGLHCGESRERGGDSRDSGVSSRRPDADVQDASSADAGGTPEAGTRFMLPPATEVTCAAFAEGTSLWRLVRNADTLRLIPPAGVSFALTMVIDGTSDRLALRSFEEVDAVPMGRQEREFTFPDEGVILVEAAALGVIEGVVTTRGAVTQTTTDVRVMGSMETGSTSSMPWPGPDELSWRAEVAVGPALGAERSILTVEETAGPLRGLLLRFDEALGLVEVERPGDGLVLQMCGCEGASLCTGSCDACE